VTTGRWWRLLIAALLVAGLPACARTGTAVSEPVRPSRPSPPPRAESAYRRLPLTFEENRGQTDVQVEYLARGPGYGLFLTPAEAVMTLHGDDDAVVRMQFVGANARPTIDGAEARPGRSNYLIGDDPTRWLTDVPTYGRVRYDELWPGVDAVFYGTQGGQLEYDFVIEPGADPGRVALEFEGARRLRLTDAGDLVIEPGDGKDVVQHAPRLFQGEREIDGGYVLHGDRVRLRVGDHDRSRPLVVDPVLTYSTYLGGTGEEAIGKISVDGAGNAYVIGGTSSLDFPTTSAYQPVHGQGSEAFVTKIDPSGSSLVYSTYLGGAGADSGYAIAIDGAGNAYVAGNTDSSDFPTVNPYQATQAGHGDVFVTKLNAAGSGLAYSTYLGGYEFGIGYDFVSDIAVDGAGRAHVIGRTYSANFPTANAYDPTFAGGDAFITKFEASGSTLAYSTFFGGSGDDRGSGIALDLAGNAYVTGSTSSTDFPTSSAYQPLSGGGDDAFVAKLVPSGASLVYSTFLGGTGKDLGAGIALDLAGSAYVTGSTGSIAFPTASPFQPAAAGRNDAFVTKLAPSGASLVYSTFLGGTDNDSGSGIAVDPAGGAHLTGLGSTGFPLVAPYQRVPGPLSAAFVAWLSPAGSALVWSTFLAGNGLDVGGGIAVDAAFNTYVVGRTSSSDFPTADAYQPMRKGPVDAFVTKLAPTAYFDAHPAVSSHALGLSQAVSLKESRPSSPACSRNYGPACATPSTLTMSSTDFNGSPSTPVAVALCNAAVATSDATHGCDFGNALGYGPAGVANSGTLTLDGAGNCCASLTLQLPSTKTLTQLGGPVGTNSNPAAVCPPTPAQIAAGWTCRVVLMQVNPAVPSEPTGYAGYRQVFLKSPIPPITCNGAPCGATIAPGTTIVMTGVQFPCKLISPDDPTTPGYDGFCQAAHADKTILLKRVSTQRIEGPAITPASQTSGLDGSYTITFPMPDTAFDGEPYKLVPHARPCFCESGNFNGGGKFVIQ
jgi:hypothetical protein